MMTATDALKLVVSLDGHMRDQWDFSRGKLEAGGIYICDAEGKPHVEIDRSYLDGYRDQGYVAKDATSNECATVYRVTPDLLSRLT